MLDYRINESDIQQQTGDAKRQQETIPPSEPPRLKPNPGPQRRKPSFLQWFYDLPISRKQLIALFSSEILSLVLIGFGARWIIETGLRNQLLNQASSEVAVTEINYNIKVNQMGFGFRGQADNTAIIAAAQSQTLSPDLRNQVKQILQNEVKARNIEYATLVGRDLRIIVNANADRQGEIFNPNNLVKEVFSDPRQIKASAIVSRAELAKESPPLPAGFDNQDALIRYTVTAVRDPATKTIIGALVSGDIVNGKLPIVQGTLKAFGGGYSAVYLRKPTGEFTSATALDQAQSNIDLPNSSLLAAAAKANGKPVTGRMEVGEQTYTLAAKALPNVSKEQASGPVPVAATGEPVAILVRGTPETALNELLNRSLLQELAVLLLVLPVIVIWTLILRRAIPKPIEQLQRTTKEFSEGDYGARAEVFARDEVGQLAVTFNEMADSIETNLKVRRQEAEGVQLFANIAASRLRDFQDLDPIFNQAVQGAREILKADRVVVYRFNPDWSGYVVAESVLTGWPKALAVKINDPCISKELIEAYRNGRVVPTNNVLERNYSPEHMKLLSGLEVKENLVMPILQNEQLSGLLIAHHCSGPHAWQQSEIDFLKKLAVQVGLSIDLGGSLENQRIAKEQLQKRALELLMEVDPVSRGDLTIRASVTEDEIGTIADSYNATIESLRKIVTQVQAAAKQVTTTTSSSTQSVQDLSKEALRQTEEITVALDQIEEMSTSIRAVAANAQQAEVAVLQATQTVEAGDAAMNRTVDGILALRETVAQTSKKVKRLGESSQKISKVVNLIGTFADKTNLLALNASIEAAHAGEQGRGFAVVAEQVRALARQSAQATAEIESLVKDIQTETNEVVTAMEAGTQQVVEGTLLVDETRISLNKITAVSAQIGALVEAIALATVAQTHASESVTQTMTGVAAISSKTSTEATLVSASFKELLAVATELQASAAQFKVS